ncbi:MAG: hypothetical protein KDA96_07825, partial [Planctomycetaceae bacterium]|nr:hypothetical protein [Planctomycetaceae bacterium]
MPEIRSANPAAAVPMAKTQTSNSAVVRVKIFRAKVAQAGTMAEKAVGVAKAVRKVRLPGDPVTYFVHSPAPESPGTHCCCRGWPFEFPGADAAWIQNPHSAEIAGIGSLRTVAAAECLAENSRNPEQVVTAIGEEVWIRGAGVVRRWL